MSATRYQLIQSVDGQLLDSLFNPNVDVIAAMEIRGYKYVGTCQNRGIRAELKDQPVFAGLAGPMFDGFDADGRPIVRYEDTSVNKVLST